jgi:hypothetical protein
MLTATSEARRPDEAGIRVRKDARARKLTSLDANGSPEAEQLQSFADAATNDRSESYDAATAGRREGPATSADTKDVLGRPEYLQGRPVLERIAQSVEAYTGAAEQAFGDARALFDSWAILGRGLQDWQHTYLGLSEQTLNDLDRARRSLLRCGSVLEVAEFQRATSVELMQRTVASNVALLQIAVQVGRDAAGPLRAREEARRHP